MQKKLAVSALAALPVIAAVAFGNPANASAAEQTKPAATKPTPEQCALILKMKPKQVLNLARQIDQRAAFGKLLSPDAIQQCPVTVSYQELRGAIDSAQQNQSLVGLTYGLALGAAGVLALTRHGRGR